MHYARRTGEDTWNLEPDDHVDIVKMGAPTTEADWVTLLTALIGNVDAAQTAYANVLAAAETDDDVVVLWTEDNLAA